jgi:YVTN family beta-propeller protein
MIKSHVSIILGLIVLEFVLIMFHSQVYGQLSKVSNLDINISLIQVGKKPIGIAVDPNTHKAYVSNSGNNTVSVIDGATNRVIGDPIPVGDGPRGIAVDTSTHLVYVTNPGSNTVSVTDESSNKPLVGIEFYTSANVNSVYVKCDNNTIPTNRIFLLEYNTQCIALPNKGFQLVVGLKD